MVSFLFPLKHLHVDTDRHIILSSAIAKLWITVTSSILVKFSHFYYSHSQWLSQSLKYCQSLVPNPWRWHILLCVELLDGHLIFDSVKKWLTLVLSLSCCMACILTQRQLRYQERSSSSGSIRVSFRQFVTNNQKQSNSTKWGNTFAIKIAQGIHGECSIMLPWFTYFSCGFSAMN